MLRKRAEHVGGHLHGSDCQLLFRADARTCLAFPGVHAAEPKCPPRVCVPPLSGTCLRELREIREDLRETMTRT